jgi:hypothetical protein
MLKGMLSFLFIELRFEIWELRSRRSAADFDAYGWSHQHGATSF